MLDEYLNQEPANFVLTNTANTHSYRVHLELGASTVPVGEWEKRPIWITNYSGLLLHWFSERVPYASRLFSYPLATLLELKDTVSRVSLARCAANHGRVELPTNFDTRFDVFWKELCARYADRLLAARDRETLDWHFKTAARQNRLTIYTLTRDERLIAYAVFILQRSDPADPIKRLLLADYQSLEPGEAPFCSILRAVLERCRGDGVHLVVTTGFSANGTDTSARAPYRRSLQNNPFLYSSRDPELSRTLKRPEVWCPTLYDADASL